MNECRSRSRPTPTVNGSAPWVPDEPDVVSKPMFGNLADWTPRKTRAWTAKANATAAALPAMQPKRKATR